MTFRPKPRFRSHTFAVSNGESVIPNFSTLESIALGLEIPVSILIFLAKKDELTSISPELADRLANVTLSLIQSPSAHEPSTYKNKPIETIDELASILDSNWTC